MEGVFLTPCATCKHKWPGGIPPRCDAFPGDIPDAILLGTVVHDKPLPHLGQLNDLVYDDGRPGFDQTMENV